MSGKIEKSAIGSDLTSVVLSQIGEIKERKRLELEEREREKTARLAREQKQQEEESKRRIDNLREQHKTAIEIVNGKDWIGAEDLMTDGLTLPMDVFLLVKKVVKDVAILQFSGSCRASDEYSGGHYVRGVDDIRRSVEIKILRQELREQFKRLLGLDKESLDAIGGGKQSVRYRGFELTNTTREAGMAEITRNFEIIDTGSVIPDVVKGWETWANKCQKEEMTDGLALQRDPPPSFV